MPRVTVEYLGGPACGKRRTVTAGPSGAPPERMVVTIPERWASALDDKPIPASAHVYQRLDPIPTSAGPLWRYHHHGPLPEPGGRTCT